MSSGPNQQMPQYPMPVLMAPPSPMDNEPPARVKAALEFLSHAAHKASTRCAVNDIQISWHKGQALTVAESNVMADACSMLQDYFLGRLKPDIWEKERQEAMRRESNHCHHHHDEEFEHEGPPGRMMPCPSCPPEGPCPFCYGTKKLVVFPGE